MRIYASIMTHQACQAWSKVRRPSPACCVCMFSYVCVRVYMCVYVCISISSVV